MMVRKYSDLICCDVTFITCSKLNYVYVILLAISSSVPSLPRAMQMFYQLSVWIQTHLTKRSTASCNTHLVNWLVTKPARTASFHITTHFRFYFVCYDFIYWILVPCCEMDKEAALNCKLDGGKALKCLFFSVCDSRYMWCRCQVCMSNHSSRLS